MEGCLLCLELNSELMDTIKVDSTQWQEMNIKNLIEQHLWPMQTIQYSTWICTKCWQELYDFHKFYRRIEEAHKTLKSLMKTELANESHFKPGISMHETLSSAFILEERKISIKEEQDEDLWEDDTPLIEMSKRGRQMMDKNVVDAVTEDPLNKTIKLKHIKTRARTKTKKKVSYKNAKTTKGISTVDSETVEKSDMNHETHLLEPNELNNDQADSDFSYEPDDGTTLNNDNKTSSHNNSKTNNHKNDRFIAENFKLTCIICQIPMETFQSLCKHFKKEHKQPGYIICCKKKFYRRSLLVDHVNQHLDPNYFKCDDCGKVAADRLCLRLHRKIHETKREKNHCCDICGKGFVTRKVLNTHKAIHLSEEEKLFPCTECNKNFGNKMQLSNHVRAVHLNLNAKICDICGKSIRCKEVFERHMAEHEGKPLPTVTCDICGLLLANKHGLKRHKDMIHPVGGKQEHICPICSKISPNLKAHKKHIQYKHELGYNHKCTICEKAFKSAQTLTEHMATHTGTVLYTCPWCPKTFNSNANMHSHRKKVHRKEWEEETRKKYSGNLPPNYKSPAANKVNEEYQIPLYMQ